MRRFSEMRWEIRQTTKEKIMGIFSMILSLLSGVALFLFGMSLMGDGLKMVAGNKLEAFLYRMTNTPLKGVALGTGVTSVIQSSSATTVMVIGFVNSGMMKLKQAIGIIMGANIGTSITGWILSFPNQHSKVGIHTLRINLSPYYISQINILDTTSLTTAVSRIISYRLILLISTCITYRRDRYCFFASAIHYCCR